MKEAQLIDLLENRIDGLQKEKRQERDSERLKTIDEVFDHHTLLVIYDLITSKKLDTIEFPISTGKEGNIFYGLTPDGEPVAVKIFRIATATFRNLARYIAGDPRFRVPNNHRQMVFTWAQKEYKNLMALTAAGIKVPSPHIQKKNILIMEYIGDDSGPAPQLRNVELDDPEECFDIILDMVTMAFKKAKLVHGDLSEYNILYWDGPIIIDVAQSVHIQHPSSMEFLSRDLRNICKYFGRLGIQKNPSKLFTEVVS